MTSAKKYVSEIKIYL